MEYKTERTGSSVFSWMKESIRVSFSQLGSYVPFVVLVIMPLWIALGYLLWEAFSATILLWDPASYAKMKIVSYDFSWSFYALIILYGFVIFASVFLASVAVSRFHQEEDTAWSLLVQYAAKQFRQLLFGTVLACGVFFGFVIAPNYIFTLPQNPDETSSLLSIVILISFGFGIWVLSRTYLWIVPATTGENKKFTAPVSRAYAITKKRNWFMLRRLLGLGAGMFLFLVVGFLISGNISTAFSLENQQLSEIIADTGKLAEVQEELRELPDTASAEKKQELIEERNVLAAVQHIPLQILFGNSAAGSALRMLILGISFSFCAILWATSASILQRELAG